MNVIAYFSPNDFWPELFTALKDKNPEATRYNSIPSELWEICASADQVEIAFSELERKSLIELKDGIWRVHRLIQFVQRMIIDNRAGAWESAAAILAATYPGKEPVTRKGKNVADRGTWKLCERLNPHVAQLVSISEKSVDSIPFEYLLNQSSLYFAYNDTPNLAGKYAVNLLRRKKLRFPANHKSIGAGYHNLSYRLADLGNPKLRWAMQSSSRAVAIAEGNPEISLVGCALWTSRHGQTILDYAATKKDTEFTELLTKARQQTHKALKMVRPPGGGVSASMSVGLNCLGGIFESQGLLCSAALMFRSSLSVARKDYGDGHVETAKRSSNLGRVLIKSADCRSARPYILNALRIQEDAYGENIRHPGRLSSAKWMATLEFLEGQRAAVESIVSRYQDYLSTQEIAGNASQVRSSWAGDC
jgi:hypothetical protein